MLALLALGGLAVVLRRR
ncbi:MAG: hypothetical protein GY842_08340 [bacterium]|nr:hypothetical protein [bacterium]